MQADKLFFVKSRLNQFILQLGKQWFTNMGNKMQKEYIFYDNIGLDFPLSEEIELVKVASKGEYLVSNHPEAEAIIYAPEINFYLKQSNDSIAQKINNVIKLYAMRALGFDFAQDMDYSQEVGDKVLIVTEDVSHEALKEELR